MSGVRIVGLRSGAGAVLAGALTPAGDGVVALATVDEFWSDPRRWLAAAAIQGYGPVVPLDRAELVPPVPAGARVLCIGLNYLKHVAEGSYAAGGVPEHPTIFARWPVSLTVGGAVIPVPSGEDGLDWEGEVVAWVGETLVDATPEQALSAVVGYSTFNDVTARRAQKLTSQWILGKNGDRSGPLGPLVPAAEVGDLRDGLTVVTRVNGEEVQRGRTDEMVYTVGETLALISRTMTLRPGDLLATGTPAGVGYTRTPPWLLRPGDEVEVEVERLGILRNPVGGNEVRHT
ncbi:fumarylacetoacetate hydrolase family protein [Dactylosporangium sp. NPDC005555]|uniref:fumarylacetoacetate hydrolase family protein n=1 Tax=Dactylosporangium sp. NPDC005555 TaxID=3154889 RepID=UPI0033AB23BF